MSLLILPGLEHSEDDFSLSPAIIESLWRMEERHFWHAARNEWIRAVLERHGAFAPAQVLEVGCGSGAVSCYLQRLGYQVTGVDTAERLVRKAASRCPAATFVAGDVARLPAQCRGPYPVIGFFDVLEHLAAPEKLLESALRFAAPNALVVATVPALRRLHSVVDDLSGHKRRYETGELARLLSSAGAVNVSEYGIFRLLLPQLRRHRTASEANLRAGSDAATRVMLDNLRIPPAPVNSLLRGICTLERLAGLDHARNRPGATLIAAGRLRSAGTNQ